MLHFALLLECQFSGNVTNIPAVLLLAIISLSMVSIVDSLQDVNASRISQSYFCVVRPRLISLALAVRAVSLFSSRAATLVSCVLQ